MAFTFDVPDMVGPAPPPPSIRPTPLNSNNNLQLKLQLLEQAASHRNKAIGRWIETALKVHNAQEVFFLLHGSYHLQDCILAQGMTALHLAAYEGHDLIVAQLLTEEPSLADATDREQRNALDGAVVGGEAVVALLLERCPQLIHGVDREGRTPLHAAAMYGKTNIMAQLLAADPSLINKLDSRGRTALHWAVEWGKEDAMDMLLATRSWSSLLGKEARLCCMQRSEIIYEAKRSSQNCWH